MKFVTVRDFKSHPTKVWKELQEEDELVITSSGKPIALVTSVSEAKFESTLTMLRRAKASAAVTAMQSASIDKGSNMLSLRELNREMNAARNRRK